MMSTRATMVPALVILALSCLPLLLLLLPPAWAGDNQSSGHSGDERVQLGVFMESRCPDSRRFFNSQLMPTYREIGSIMSLNLVPFGHARTLGSGKMVCQHGPRECEGNRRMACVQSRGNNQSQIVEAIGCLFEGQLSVQECIEKKLPGASYADIEKCAHSDESYQMMVKAEKETGRVDYVPHLTVNNEWSNEIQNEAENELKKFMCQKYKGKEPVEGCKNVAAAPASEPLTEASAF